MQRWIVLAAVWLCMWYLMIPIKRWLFRRIDKEWLAYLLTFLISVVIYVGLYCIADLCGLG